MVNFTVLISVINNDLRSVSNGGHVESENGYDIIFTQGDCSTLLNHQIEKYDPVAGELVFWVQIPSLSASENTNIHMYYGNSGVATDPSTTSTWNSNYEGVWHMNNDPSASPLLDYSGDGIDGESHGGMTASDLVSGKIGDAIDFDGSNDYFSLALKNYTTTGIITQMTVSAWVKTSFSHGTWTRNWAILDFDRSEYYNICITGDGRFAFSTSRPGSTFNDSFAGTAGDLNDDEWHFVTAVYNGTNKLLYVDGVLSFTQVNPHGGLGIGTGTTRYGFIGDGSEANSYDGSRNNIYYDGQYDEIRFTTDILSADWIATEYNNQNSPASFYTIGDELPAGDLCTLLPIELFRFDALQNNNRVALTWTTLSERNNAYFTVERSHDGFSDWELIAKVEGAGNSSTELNYEAFDLSPNNGINYYRLKQTDFNGDFENFYIQSVLYQQESHLFVFPNPASDRIQIQSKFPLNKTEIQVFDLQGRNVNTHIKITADQNNSLHIDLTHLEKGIYIIQTKRGMIRFEKL